MATENPRRAVLVIPVVFAAVAVAVVVAAAAAAAVADDVPLKEIPAGDHQPPRQYHRLHLREAEGGDARANKPAACRYLSARSAPEGAGSSDCADDGSSAHGHAAACCCRWA